MNYIKNSEISRLLPRQDRTLFYDDSIDSVVLSVNNSLRDLHIPDSVTVEDVITKLYDLYDKKYSETNKNVKFDILDIRGLTVSIGVDSLMKIHRTSILELIKERRNAYENAVNVSRLNPNDAYLRSMAGGKRYTRPVLYADEGAIY